MKLNKVVPLLSCVVVSLLGLAALPAFGEDAGALKNSASWASCSSRRASMIARRPARRRISFPIRPGRSRCRTAGCSDRSAASMSIVTTISGSITGRAPSPMTRSGWRRRCRGVTDAKGQPANALGFARVQRLRRGLLQGGALGAGVRCRRQAAALLGRPGRSRLSRRQVQGRSRLHLAEQRARHLCRRQGQCLDRRQRRGAASPTPRPLPGPPTRPAATASS